jgi:hypothetical protein
VSAGTRITSPSATAWLHQLFQVFASFVGEKQASSLAGRMPTATVTEQYHIHNFRELALKRAKQRHQQRA